MTEYTTENYEYKTIIIDWGKGTSEEQVDVVIGDGKTVFDEDFPFDARIFFYFHDDAEFQKAKGKTILPDIGFRVLAEEGDDD